MKLKSLHLINGLYEKVIYDEHTIPLVTCIDNFDEYTSRQWSMHWHEGFEFTTLLQGKCQYQVQDSNNKLTTISLKPDDGIFINSAALHSVQALEPNTITACCVLPPTFFEFKSFMTLKNSSVLPISRSGVNYLYWSREDKQDHIISESIEELCKLSEKEIGYELHSVELVCRIWRLMLVSFQQHHYDQIKQPKNIQSERIRSTIQFIHENYQRPHLTVNDLASAANISRAECFRAFKAVLNQTPMEYLNDYRMSMAEMFLITTTRSVKEITQMCGFNTASYFGKEFHRRYETTPKKYRLEKSSVVN
ncbi:AraC family transcriptional regulator [Companilactobacillus sp. HBUAS56275]|uniref:AraC family transcriptional regulator n=1 Tax=Candidatus Companilactobacillus pullicola TaxID=2838523 RepID=A0A9D2CLB7_9LACO|nr:AraC family transcriptional regulator [Candidatus Companilactobacillus pullicola]